MADNVRIVVVHAGEIVVVSEKPPDNPDEFKLPGGRMHLGESPEKAARREMAEELGEEAAEEAVLIFVGELTTDDGGSKRYIFRAEGIGPQDIVPGADIAALMWVAPTAIPPSWKNHGHITSAVSLAV